MTEDTAKCFISDISNGIETVHISFLNERNVFKIPKYFNYISSSVVTSKSLLEDFESIPVPCNCQKHCTLGCSCGNGRDIAYTDGVLRKSLVSLTSVPIVECSVLCSCDAECPNRVVQNGIKFQLQVFMTESKGLGVRTLEFIPKMKYICEYAGELIDETEVKKRMQMKSEDDANYIYVLKEQSSGQPCQTIVDPTYCGNVGRFLNHSCSPNLVSVPVRANSMIPKICFFAKQDLKPNEELTYHYGNGEPTESLALSSKKCFCLSTCCSGYLPFDANWI